MLHKRKGSAPLSSFSFSKAKNEPSSKKEEPSSQASGAAEVSDQEILMKITEEVAAANLEALQLASSTHSSESSSASASSTTISATVDALLPLPPLSMHPIPMPPPAVVQLPIEGTSPAIQELNSGLNPQIVQMFGHLPPGELPMPASQASFQPGPVLAPYLPPPPPTIAPPVLIPSQFMPPPSQLLGSVPPVVTQVQVPSEVYEGLVQSLQFQQPGIAAPPRFMQPMQVPSPPKPMPPPMMPRAPPPPRMAPPKLPPQSIKKQGKTENASISQLAAGMVSAATEKPESSDTEAPVEMIKLEPSETSSESAESKGFGSDKENLDTTVTVPLEPIELLKEQIVEESEHSGTDNQDSDAADVSSKPVSKSSSVATSSSHYKSASVPLPAKLPLASKKSLSAHKPEKPPRSAKVSSDEADLVELVNKIISVSEQVARVVKALKKEAGSYSRQASISTPLTETPQEAAFAYEKAMKPLQFGE